MATTNSRGQMIQELSVNDPEDRRYIEISRTLSVLRFPEDEVLLRHLSYRYFCQWIYGLDPKVALYLTNVLTFRKLQQTVKNKSFLSRLYDRAWRSLHGFNF